MELAREVVGVKLRLSSVTCYSLDRTETIVAIDLRDFIASVFNALTRAGNAMEGDDEIKASNDDTACDVSGDGYTYFDRADSTVTILTPDDAFNTAS